MRSSPIDLFREIVSLAERTVINEGFMGRMILGQGEYLAHDDWLNVIKLHESLRFA